MATEFKEARAPEVSRPDMGLAPGARGSPCFRPSGVLPVFLPYITLEVMVKMLRVCLAERYRLYWAQGMVELLCLLAGDLVHPVVVVAKLGEVAFDFKVGDQAGFGVPGCT